MLGENNETTTGKVIVTLDESTQLIVLSFSAPGKDDDEHEAMANETKRLYQDILRKHPEAKFKVLVNLTNTGIPSKRAIEIYINTLSEKHIEKTAFFGMTGAIQSIISFISEAAGRGQNTRFFIDEAQARGWLLS